MEKRLMLVGLDGAGKTTLADLVEGSPGNPFRSQDCRYHARTIEVPGSYVENNWMHKVILIIAQNQGSSMALLVDGSTLASRYSSGYTRAFTVPVLGVLTHAGGLDEEGRAKGERLLRDAGCERVLALDTQSGEGVEEFLAWASPRT